MKQVFFFLFAVFLVCGCNPTVKITFDQPADEVYTRQTLKDYSSNEQKTILLRTPNQSNTTTTNTTSDQSPLYNYIEKDFFKSGYIVRDRAIFEKVLSQNQDFDYSKAKELTNTDFIIEIVSLQKQQYSTNKYQKNGKTSVASDCHWRFMGYKIDVRIVKVKDNEVAGVFAFYQTPCPSPDGCDFDLHKCQLQTPTAMKGKGYTARSEDSELQNFAAYVTDKLIKAMK